MTISVLLVDDNVALREIFGMYLVSAGYNVVEASDGESALRLARNETITLAVIDVILPGRNGVSVLDALRRSSRMPILLISSLPESEVAWEVYGANGFMRKPLRPKELVSRVATLLASADKESPSETSLDTHASEASCGHA